jgi:alpha-beta hydrolase superfamily lysophospholipase
LLGDHSRISADELRRRILVATKPRALVVICHGVNSHSGQYLWVGEQLAAAGYAVYPVLKLKNEDFSRDPKAVEALNHDPLTAHEVQPAITVAALVHADERLRDEFPHITLPVLIMHGTDDKATVCHGSQFFYETVGSKDKTLKLYDGHYHDLLNDLGKEKVMADINGWIDAHLAPAS